MKVYLNIATLLLILSTQSGCEKRIFDYRNKYVGEYTINTEIDSHADGGLSTEHITYKGKVYYDKSGERDEIIIVYYDGKQCKTTIDKTGKVTHVYHFGEFSDKKTFKIGFENNPNGSATTMTGTKL